MSQEVWYSYTLRALDGEINRTFSAGIYALDDITLRRIDIIESLGHGLYAGGCAVATISSTTITEVGDYGIEIDGAELQVSGSTFEDADIAGIFVNADTSSSEADIDNCTFSNNDIGVKIVKTNDATIDGSTFSNNTTCGVFVDSSTTTVQTSTLQNNGVGAYFYNHSPGGASQNTIKQNSTGVKCAETSHAMVFENEITLNTVGAEARSSSLPNLGGGADGYNTLAHNTQYHVSNQTDTTVSARNNYWKNHRAPCEPPSAKINGSVDYSAALCSPPSLVVVIPIQAKVPDTYSLNQNYPNPFNPTTTIKFAVPQPGGTVKIAIYNVRGQLVRTLVDGHQAPGFYEAVWDGTNNQGNTISTGIYFLNMHAPGFVKTRKMLLLK